MSAESAGSSRPGHAGLAAAPTLSDSPSKSLRILFVMLHPGYVRNYEGALRLLLERGHWIHLAFLQPDKQATDRVAERLAIQYGRLTIGRAAKPERGRWRNVALSARTLADLSRYLHPRYADAPALRARVEDKLRNIRHQLGLPLMLLVTAIVRLIGDIQNARISDWLVRFLLAIDARLPTSTAIDGYLRSQNPDLMLLTPLVTVGSWMPEFFKSAARRGLRSALCVASWDNLSNKGLVKASPNATFVWNETQLAEATEMHDLPADRVFVTGAPRFDDWFAQEPTLTREELCRSAGLDPDKPFVLYLCSSPFIAPDEVSFVQKMIKHRDASPDPAVRELGVLIRPHPQNADQWADANLSTFENVIIWPRAGEQPVDSSSRAAFYDSIAHSTAVVGINTSAQIEAGIIGRAVHTVLDEQFADTQKGTVHFHYLLAENGGLLHVAPDLDALWRNLAAGEAEAEARVRAFIHDFVRPHGLDRPATPIMVAEIELLAARPKPARLPEPRGSRAVRAALSPLAVASYTVPLRHIPPRLARPVLRALRAPQSAALPGATPEPNTSKKSGAQIDKVNARAVKGQLARRSKAGEQLLLGPWTGDVTTELLCWLPFLRWASQRYSFDRTQVIAVSRGGVSAWYQDFTDDYVDVLDLFDVDSLQRAAANGRRSIGGKGLTAFEKEILESIRSSRGPTAVLGSGLLDLLLRRYRAGHSPLRHALTHLDYELLAAPVDIEVEARLPSSYVAVQFLAGGTLPATSQNLDVARRLLDTLTESTDVVVLGAALGGRTPFDLNGLSGNGRVFMLDEDVDPRRSLHVQSVVVSRAQGFVGSYGDAAHMATRHGVPTVALYSDGTRINQYEIDLAQRAAAATETSFALVDAAGSETLFAGLAHLRGSPPRSDVVSR